MKLEGKLKRNLTWTIRRCFYNLIAFKKNLLIPYNPLKTLNSELVFRLFNISHFMNKVIIKWNSGFFCVFRLKSRLEGGWLEC